MAEWIKLSDDLPPVGELVAAVMQWSNSDGSAIFQQKCCAIRREQKYRMYPWLVNGCVSQGEVLVYWQPLPDPPPAPEKE